MLILSYEALSFCFIVLQKSLNFIQYNIQKYIILLFTFDFKLHIINYQTKYK